MSDTTPAEIEAAAPDTVQVAYAGNTYTFPPSLEDADGDVIDAVDDLKLSHALRGLMSEDDWAKFKATKPTVKGYSELFAAFAKVVGLGSAGE